MNIKKLTEDYRKHFETYGRQMETFPDDGKKRTWKNMLSCPNYLKQVVRPVLDTLAEVLLQYGFKPTTDSYAMYGEYYRIKAGVMLVGGFSMNGNFELVFTPLFHGRPCGKGMVVSDMKQLCGLVENQFRERNADRMDKSPSGTDALS